MLCYASPASNTASQSTKTKINSKDLLPAMDRNGHPMRLGWSYLVKGLMRRWAVDALTSSHVAINGDGSEMLVQPLLVIHGCSRCLELEWEMLPIAFSALGAWASAPLPWQYWAAPLARTPLFGAPYTGASAQQNAMTSSAPTRSTIAPSLSVMKVHAQCFTLVLVEPQGGSALGSWEEGKSSDGSETLISTPKKLKPNQINTFYVFIQTNPHHLTCEHIFQQARLGQN